MIELQVPHIEVIISVASDYSVVDLYERVLELPGVDHNIVSKTEHYVFATLTPQQIILLDEHSEVRKIWRNHGMASLMEKSATILDAPYAWEDLGVLGDGVIWAVIDNGVDDTHESLKQAVIGNVDFTNEGANGNHGTHIASIIAGYCPEKNFSGLAPKAKLYNFKVIGQKQSGVSLTIQAMEKIRNINKEAGKMVIHGANMSIGTKADLSFQPGLSPVCEEANRLVESGVVVCIAAGDHAAEDFAVYRGDDLNHNPTLITMSILDPGNAELPITVGSTHKENPDKYGVSNFSAKGPTGDGRLKPDMVAPGEKILGAYPGDLYMRLTGTSQAAAHVSGVAALVLSAYPELIGQPEKVKEVLIESCQDLKRDPYFQGAGLINAKKAIQVAGSKKM
jgi:subtilisin family serine protease